MAEKNNKPKNNKTKLGATFFKKTGKTENMPDFDPSFVFPKNYFLSKEIFKLLIELVNNGLTIRLNSDLPSADLPFLKTLNLGNDIGIREHFTGIYYEIYATKEGIENIKSFLENYLQLYKNLKLLSAELFINNTVNNISALPYEQSAAQVLSALKNLNINRYTTGKEFFLDEEEDVIKDLSKSVRLYEILISLFLEGFISLENNHVEVKRDLSEYQIPLIYKTLSIKDNSLFCGKEDIANLKLKKKRKLRLLLTHLFQKGGKDDLEPVAKTYGYKPNKKTYGGKKRGDKNTLKRDSVRDLTRELNPKLRKCGFEILATKKEVAINYVESTATTKKSKAKVK